MPRDGFGIGMLVMGVGEIGSLLYKESKSALAKTIFIAVDKVGSKSIDGNLQDEPDFRFGLCVGIGEVPGQEQSQDNHDDLPDAAYGNQTRHFSTHYCSSKNLGLY
jgi:hypothetical protein